MYILFINLFACRYNSISTNMDNEISLHKALDCAKNFKNSDYVLMAVTLHPEWLTTIPDGRRWALLHHIVFSGNITNLEQLLALQQLNKQFRLLIKSNNNETVLDIAKVRDDQSQMLQRIERLIKLDEMLNYAIACDWDKCYDIVKENPDYGNEKPPYRRYYLVHHMACADVIDQFERFRKIENFRFNLALRADRKKINVIAREQNKEKFAQYLEENYPSYFNKNEKNDEFYEPSENAKKHTDNIITLMENRTTLPESDFNMGPVANVMSRTDVINKVKHKLPKSPQSVVAKQFLAEHSVDTIHTILLCSLTNAIVTDPGK